MDSRWRDDSFALVNVKFTRREMAFLVVNHISRECDGSFTGGNGISRERDA